jgi:hypothetical protein
MLNRLFMTGVSIVLLMQLSGMASGQSKDKTDASDELKIFHLENIKPDDAVTVLNKLFVQTAPGSKTPRFATDLPMKALIAKGDKETLLSIEALLLLLDEKKREAQPNLAPKSLVIRLKHATPNVVSSALMNAFINTSVQQDNHAHAIYVTTTGEHLASLLDLVKKMDAPITTEIEDISIRIVWLVESSLTKEKGEPVPEDLAAPLAALRKKLGLGELRPAAETLVRCSPDGSTIFHASGTSNLDRPYAFEFSGNIRQTDTGKYSLQIQGSTKRSGEEGPSSQLNTSCASVGIGQPIILGTTSIDSRASVFVIQILEN